MRRLSVLMLVMAFVMPMGAFAAGAAEEEETIAGIVFFSDQFFRIVQGGMDDAAAEMGVVVRHGDSNDDPAMENELVNTYTAQGVNAIVISPLSEQASIAPLQAAHADGIPIVTYNTELAADFPVASIVSDQHGLGASTGGAARTYIEEELGGDAKIAILQFDALNPEQSGARVNGFISQIEDLPGVEVVTRQDAWLAEDAVSVGEDIFTAHPDVDIVFAANEGGTVGALQAVRNAGREGQTAVFGTDATQQLMEGLLADDGILQAVTGQQPYEIGYRSAMKAIKAIRGEPIEENEIIIPGVLFTREDRDEIHEFLAFLEDF